MEHNIVSRDEWLGGRIALLAKENASSKLRDQLSAERRALPWVMVEKDDVFDGLSGKVTLAELFDGRSQLFVKHFMMGPGEMAAAMGMYRAIADDEKFAKERRGPLNVPLTLVPGGNSFGPLLTAMAKGLEDAGAKSVATETVAGSGHYLLDEKPAETTALIERYASIASSER